MHVHVCVYMHVCMRERGERKRLKISHFDFSSKELSENQELCVSQASPRQCFCMCLILSSWGAGSNGTPSSLVEAYWWFKVEETFSISDIAGSGPSGTTSVLLSLAQQIHDNCWMRLWKEKWQGHKSSVQLLKSLGSEVRNSSFLGGPGDEFCDFSLGLWSSIHGLQSHLWVCVSATWWFSFYAFNLII